LNRGDEIILPAFTYPAVSIVIESSGLKPVLIDIIPENYDFNFKELEKNITSKTRAIISTHLY
jgi:dTDP-4-amino-4,6-dideoxygalactose transaminase